MRHHRPPLKDIMRVSGLSRATIDRVLNGREGVLPRTQAVVDSAIAQLEKEAVSKTIWPEKRRPLTYRIVVQAGDAFTQSMIDEVELLAPQLESNGCFVEVTSCVGYSSERVAEIILSQDAADGIVIIAKNESPIVEAAIAVREFGKAVITSHSDLDIAARHAYVGIDNRAAGQSACFLMGRHMAANSLANVAVVVGTMSYRCHEEREMGYRSVLRQRFPGLNLIEVVKCDDTREATYTSVKRLLETCPTIDGIYNTAGGNQGVAQALAEHGRSEKTLFVTHEFNTVTEALIRNDAVDYLITQNMKRMVLEAVDQLTVILAGGSYSPQTIIPLEILCRYSLPTGNGNGF